MTFEVDKSGNGTWEVMLIHTKTPGESGHIEFTEDQRGEWVRAVSNNDSRITVHFTYASYDTRPVRPNEKFRGLTEVNSSEKCEGLIYNLGNDRRALGMSARHEGADAGYYELDAE